MRTTRSRLVGLDALLAVGALIGAGAPRSALAEPTTARAYVRFGLGLAPQITGDLSQYRGQAPMLRLSVGGMGRHFGGELEVTRTTLSNGTIDNPAFTSVTPTFVFYPGARGRVTASVRAGLLIGTLVGHSRFAGVPGDPSPRVSLSGVGIDAGATTLVTINSPRRSEVAWGAWLDVGASWIWFGEDTNHDMPFPPSAGRLVAISAGLFVAL